MIEFQADMGDIAEAMKGLSQGQVKKLAFRAFVKTEQSMKTAASEHIRSRYTIKVKDFKKSIKTYVDMERMSIELSARGSRFPLSRFTFTPKTPQPGKRGFRVRVAVRRGQYEEQAGNIFVARMKTGHVDIFERTGPKRTPIHTAFGPHIADLLSGETAKHKILDTAAKTFEENFDKNVKRELGI